MGLKQFKSDLTAAKTGTFERVSGIRTGDSDGEVVFTYSFGDVAPLEIRALSTDVDSYPRGSGFLVFTASEHAGRDLEHFIQELSSSVEGKDVASLVQTVSKRLTRRFERDPDGSEDVETLDEEEDLYEDSGSDDGYVSDPNDESFLDLDPLPSRRRIVSPALCDQASLRRLRKDLEGARDAGYRVGVLSTNPDSRIFSTSIRVSELGIPEEALEAWGLEQHDYVVLLIRVPGGYPPASEYLKLPSDQNTIQFRFGKCDKPKPALASARASFETQVGNDAGEDESEESSTQQQVEPNMFSFLHMSASLNPLLNQELPLLLNIRRQFKCSWDEAQSIKFNLARSSLSVEKHLQDMKETEVDVEDHDAAQPEPEIPDLIHHDHALKPIEDLNVLLVAMQLAVKRLVHCNQYCMVWHQKVKSSFEAIKPYVCDEPLCLYQYLSLGFGQSIEHEIVNNPFVIDLLICFFYSAAMNNGFREFPHGLGLTFPYVGDKDCLSPHYKAEVDFESKTVRFPVNGDLSYVMMKEGDSVLLVMDAQWPNAPQSIISGNCERYHCIVDSIQGNTFAFKIMAVFTRPHNVQDVVTSAETLACNRKPGWTSVYLFRGTKDIDDLEAPAQSIALAHISHSIPSVPEMRKWLVEHPGRRLSSWKYMHSPGLRLLNWIVASNRSHLVQEGSLRTQPFPDSSFEIASDQEPIEDVQGTHPPNSRWMQFKFVQGSPEKDVMFKKELMNMDSMQAGPHPHPTIFAWHGSPLKNWHSIIRVGLDFQTTQHGRSFGNGVYFSNNLSTSQSYSQTGGYYVGNSWPKSVLRVGSAISICEIINKSTQFVSVQPHYVVGNIEWIQCRYLYVQAHPSAETHFLPKSPAPNTNGNISQDPDRQLKGSKGVVEIPISALPITRRRLLMSRLPTTSIDGPGESTGNPIVLEDDESDISEDDLDSVAPFTEDHEDIQLTPGRKRQHSPDLPPYDRPSKLNIGAYEANMNQLRLSPGHDDMKTTAFQPGSLDLDTLPRMRDPTWASSSPAALRRLNREVMDLQKIQTTQNLRELGWYIDFDKMTNLFQWIVELHSFDESIPLAQDMNRLGCESIVLEIRFGPSFPMSPPFVRVVRPKFLPFATGGGGHVLSGGGMCTELLTNSGWSPALSMEKVFLEARMNISDLNPPARLLETRLGQASDYYIVEAVASFRTAVAMHQWQMPPDLNELITFGPTST